MTEEQTKYWSEEMEKCIKSPAYFMNNYMTPKLGREVTDEEIEWLKAMANNPLAGRMRARCELNRPKNVDGKILNEYLIVKSINGHWCGVRRMAFTTGLFVNIDNFGYGHRYCYHTTKEATDALNKYYNLTLDPPGNWIKMKGAGEDRPNPNYKKDE